jgi:hypothetical protein
LFLKFCFLFLWYLDLEVLKKINERTNFFFCVFRKNMPWPTQGPSAAATTDEDVCWRLDSNLATAALKEGGGRQAEPPAADFADTGK